MVKATAAELKDLVDTTAQIIGQRGWCDGLSAPCEGKVDLWEAMRLAANRHRSHLGAYLAFMRYVLGSDSVCGWNDAPGRTVTEVRAKLREARQLAGMWVECGGKP